MIHNLVPMSAAIFLLQVGSLDLQKFFRDRSSHRRFYSDYCGRSKNIFHVYSSHDVVAPYPSYCEIACAV